MQVALHREPTGPEDVEGDEWAINPSISGLSGLVDGMLADLRGPVDDSCFLPWVPTVYRALGRKPAL